MARRPWPADAVGQTDVIRRCADMASIQVSHELDARAKKAAEDEVYQLGASSSSPNQALEPVDETPEQTETQNQDVEADKEHNDNDP